MNTGWKRADIAAALAVVLIWGLNFVAMKLALREFTPMQLGAARYLFAALPLVLLVRRPALAWRWVGLYGLVQGVGQFGLLFLALQLGMTAALASVLMQTQVFFTALLALGLLGEKPTRALVGGLLFAFVGLVCFGLNFTTAGGAAGVTAIGFVLTLGAAAMWGGSNILARHLQRIQPGYDPLQFVVWSSLAPILPFVALSWLTDAAQARQHWVQASWQAWAGVAYLGWFATVAAYGLWTWLLKRHPANQVAPWSLGVPVVGLLAGMGLLGERLSAWQVAGIACIGLALAYVMFAGRARPPMPPMGIAAKRQARGSQSGLK